MTFSIAFPKARLAWDAPNEQCVDGLACDTDPSGAQTMTCAVLKGDVCRNNAGLIKSNIFSKDFMQVNFYV